MVRFWDFKQSAGKNVFYGKVPEVSLCYHHFSCELQLYPHRVLLRKMENFC